MPVGVRLMQVCRRGSGEKARWGRGGAGASG